MFAGLPRHARLSLACALFLLLVAPPQVRGEDQPLEPGQINFRRHIGDTQDESIDPYTGTLDLSYLDYSLPGNGGLDLEFHRLYSTRRSDAVPGLPSTGEGDNATWWRYGPFGFGWDMHFGRMSRHGKYITVELGDGTRAELVQQVAGGNIWLSTEFWKLTYVMSGGVAHYTLFLPDGRQIDFGQFTSSVNDELMGWRYATAIRRNGQRIGIEYGDANNRRKVTRVVDTLGRTVSLRYGMHNGIERLDSLFFDNAGKTVATYHYPASVGDSDDPSGRLASTLIRAKSGIGDPYQEVWSYGYNRDVNGNPISNHDHLAVTSVTNPMGGATYYEYDIIARACRNPDWGGSDSRQFSITGKWLSGPGLGPYPVSSASNPRWQYLYRDPRNGDRDLNYTGIIDAEGRTTHYYFAPFNGQASDRFKAGLVHTRLIEEADGSISLLERNDWQPLASDRYRHDIPLEQSCMNPQGTWSIPSLADHRIYRGGDVAEFIGRGGSESEDPSGIWQVDATDASLFRTHYAGRDGYGNPTSVSETGAYLQNGNALWQTLKKTDTSYWYVDDGRNYIVRNKPLAVTIAGSEPDDHTAPFGGSYRIGYAYYTDASAPASFGRTRAVDRFGIVTEYGYDAAGNLAAVRDGDTNETNKVTSYGWSKGVVSRIQTPEYTVTRGINDDGTVAFETNGRGNTTRYAYSNSQRLQTIIPPKGGNRTTISYFNADGLLAETRESRGKFTATTFYDGLGRTMGTADSLGRRTSTSYYRNGLKRSEASNTGGIEYTAYDYFARVAQIKHRDGSTIAFNRSNDFETEVVETADGSSYRRTRRHRYFGTPEERYLTGILGEVTPEDSGSAYSDDFRYRYNVLGALTATLRGDSATENFDQQGAYRYHATNQLAREYYPATGPVDYGRWANGEVRTITDDQGRTRTRHYDRNNRLRAVVIGGAVERSFGYEGEQLKTSLSRDAKVDYRYDGNDRLSALTSCIHLARGKESCGKSTYVYDGNDNLRFLTYPSGLKVEYRYNANNQVQQILFSTGGSLDAVSYYTEGPQLGRLWKYTRSDGKTVEYTYDGRARHKRIGYPGLTLDYAFNQRNNLKSYRRSGWSGPAAFSYDEFNRMRHFRGPWGAGQYIYHLYSDNRNARTAGAGYDSARFLYADAGHQKLSGYRTQGKGKRTTTAFTFKAGDLVRKHPTEGPGPDQRYNYDAFHQLRQVNNGATPILRYGYDAGGNRVLKRDLRSGKNTLYFHNTNGEILSEFDGRGRHLFDYVYLDGVVVAKVNAGKGSGNASIVPMLLPLLLSK